MTVFKTDRFGNPAKCLDTWCLECNKPATWVRHTQFAGSHPYCEEHAKAEADFGESDSYKFWEKIDDNIP